MNNDLISREALKEQIDNYFHSSFSKFTVAEFLTISHDIIDNAPTVEINNEYGAIQYSNGFNDGFTTAKDTIIQSIAKQYSEHNELVPEWLSIGDMRGGAK